MSTWRRSLRISAGSAIISTIAVLCLVILLVWWLRPSDQRSAVSPQGAAQGVPSIAASATGSAVSGEPIVIAANDTTFEALSNVPSQDLSATAAWSAYVESLGSPLVSLPSNFNSQFGLLSIPASNIGPKEDWIYQLQNMPVYAYSGPTACRSMTADPSSQSCTEWIFVNAATGDEVLETWSPATSESTPSAALTTSPSGD